MILGIAKNVGKPKRAHPINRVPTYFSIDTHAHWHTNFVFFSLGIFPFCLCCTQSHLIMVVFTHNLKGCFRKNGLLKSKQIKWQKRAKMEEEKDGKSACKRLKGSSHRNDYVLSSNDHRLCTASNVLSHVLLSTQNKSAAKFSTQKCIRISILTENATHTNGDWRQDRTARHAQTPCARNELYLLPLLLVQSHFCYYSFDKVSQFVISNLRLFLFQKQVMAKSA